MHKQVCYAGNNLKSVNGKIMHITKQTMYKTEIGLPNMSIITALVRTVSESIFMRS